MIDGDIGVRADRRRANDLPLTCPGEPVQQFIRVAHRRRQPDPLNRLPGIRLDPLDHGAQMPAAVVAGKRMQFVNDDHADAAEP
jgi:hypothetical protein